MVLNTRFFNPIYHPCKYQRPSCNVQFFVYIKTIGENILLNFEVSHRLDFNRQFSDNLKLCVYITQNYNKDKEK